MKQRTKTLVTALVMVGIGILFLGFFDLQLITESNIPIWAHVAISGGSALLTAVIIVWAVRGGIPPRYSSR